jgi:hypothetical protein
LLNLSTYSIRTTLYEFTTIITKHDVGQPRGWGAEPLMAIFADHLLVPSSTRARVDSRDLEWSSGSSRNVSLHHSIDVYVIISFKERKGTYKVRIQAGRLISSLDVYLLESITLQLYCNAVQLNPHCLWIKRSLFLKTKISPGWRRKTYIFLNQKCLAKYLSKLFSFP